MKNRILPFIVALCSLAGLIVSWLTIDEHVRLSIDPSLESPLCHLSETINCAKVIGSEYGALFGIPLGSYGLVYYATIMVIGLLTLSGQVAAGPFLLVSSGAAVGVSIWLFAISHFVLGAYCPLCMSQYALNVVTMLAAIGMTWGANLFDVVARGVGAAISYPFEVVELMRRFSTRGRRWAQVTVLPLALLMYGAWHAQEFAKKLLIESPEFQLRAEQEVNSLVARWEAAPVDEIPATLSGSSADYPRGNPSAPITIVEFSDFECPYCRHFYDDIEDLLKEFEGKIYFIPKNFPLDNSCNPSMPPNAHQFACDGAFFVRCAAAQGKFWEGYRYIFELAELDKEGAVKDEVRAAIRAGAERLQLDVTKFDACMASDEPRAKIRDDLALGEKLNLQGTPSVWINGKAVPAANDQVIRAIVKRVLAQKEG